MSDLERVPEYVTVGADLSNNGSSLLYEIVSSDLEISVLPLNEAQAVIDLLVERDEWRAQAEKQLRVLWFSSFRFECFF